MHAQESWLHNLQLKKMSKFRGEQLLFSLSVLTFCNRMNCRTPGFPAPHYLPEFTQTHVHWANGAVQSSHPLSSPSPPALDLSQHQSLFQWVSFFASHGQITGVSASTSVLPMNIQDLFLQDWLVWSPCTSRDSQESFPASQFESINSSALSLLYGPTLTSVCDC